MLPGALRLVKMKSLSYSLLGRFLGEQSDDDDVNEVEMLLEAYFIQVDNTHNKLQTLHEYIDDTEVRQPMSISFEDLSCTNPCNGR